MPYVTFNDYRMFTYGQLIQKVEGMIKQRNELEQSKMELTRWQILCTIQPHIKKRLKLSDIAVFDWEKKVKKDKPLSPEKIGSIIKSLEGRPIKQVKIETLLK